MGVSIDSHFWDKHNEEEASELSIEKPRWKFFIAESFQGETYHGGEDVTVGGLHGEAVVGLSIKEPLREPLHRALFLGKRASGSRLGKNHPQGSHVGPRPGAKGVAGPQQPVTPGPAAPLRLRPRVPDGGRPTARAAREPRAGQPQPVRGVHIHGGGRRRRTAPLLGSLRPAGQLQARCGQAGRLGGWACRVGGGRGARGHVGAGAESERRKELGRGRREGLGWGAGARP